MIVRMDRRKRDRGRPAQAALLALLAALPAPVTALAQGAETERQAGETAMVSIADLRADLDALASDIHALRSMLKESGAPGYASAGGPDVIARINGMEAELRRLTGQVETARNQIEALVGTTGQRLEDLEFRLCQLDAHCDLGALMSAGLGGPDRVAPADILDVELGGDTGATGDRSGAGPIWDGAAAGLFGLPISAAERSDFDAAQALSRAGDHAAAAVAFGEVAENHAGGPLFSEARFREGQELLALGDRRGASRAWTDVFAADPSGPRAPDALMGVARIAADTGQPEPACLFLSEAMLRYGNLSQVADAAPLYDQLDCDSVLGRDPDGVGQSDDADMDAGPAPP